MRDTGWNDLGLVDGSEQMKVLVLLSSRPPAEREELKDELMNTISDHPGEKPAEEFEALFSADEATFKAVEQLATSEKMKGELHATRRDKPAGVVLEGTARAMQEAFGVELHLWGDGVEECIAPLGEPRLPPEIEDCAIAVIGLDRRSLLPRPAPALAKRPEGDRPVMPRRGKVVPQGKVRTALDLAKLYDFPEGLDGKGETIGMIFPRGGLDKDALKTYFDSLRMPVPVPVPDIVAMDGSEDSHASPKDIREFIQANGLGWIGRPLVEPGGKSAEWPVVSAAPEEDDHQPSSQAVYSMDALMSVEILGAVANGAHLKVYITPNDKLGVYHAVVQAANDGVSILVINFGLSEGDDTTWEHFLDWAFIYAVLKGVTIICASGDSGSTPSIFDKCAVEPCYPASSHWVVACGGTTIGAWDGDQMGNEEVWNEQVLRTGRGASGGGFSTEFKRPPWQTGLHDQPKRGVPDVAMNAAVESGVWLWFGNLEGDIGINAISFGTSSSAVLLAGLLARVYQGLERRPRLLGAALYDPAVREAMRPITEGNNDITQVNVTDAPYQAGPGWNPCTGLGRPAGKAFLNALGEYIKRPRVERLTPAAPPTSAGT